MEVQSLSCNGCGAALDVGPATNFVTCVHCGSRLAIKRTASSAYTEVLGQIAGHTAQMRDDLEIIRLKSELELLDVAWANKRAEYEKAEATTPTTTGGSSVGTFGCGVLLAPAGAVALVSGLCSVTAAGVGSLGDDRSAMLAAVLSGAVALLAGVYLCIVGVKGARREAEERKTQEREAAARKAALHEAQEAYENRRAEILRHLDAQVCPWDRGASPEVVRAA
jgi:hypothetical protein